MGKRVRWIGLKSEEGERPWNERTESSRSRPDVGLSLSRAGGIALIMVATKSGDNYEATFTLDVWRRWIDRLQEGDAVKLTGHPVESRRDHAGDLPPRLLDCRLEKVKLS